jgi:hypothetical protein
MPARQPADKSLGGLGTGAGAIIRVQMPAIALSTNESLGWVGNETRAKLGGETAPHTHGTLTRVLHGILEQADPSQHTFGDLERALKEVLDDVDLQVSDAARGELILANALQIKTAKLMADLDEQGARQIIAGLEEAITRREQQKDYWPEGRLNLGIAYACLGQYEEARRWLEEAVNMLRYPSDIGRSEQTLA